MNITLIIQARMGSTRLPGKVMKTLGDRTVLGHVITRCLSIPSVTKVVVATTVLEEDVQICDEATRYGVAYYRGSKDNVLSRYYEAACEAKADIVVRVTSDCPLLDPELSDELIKNFMANGFDYSSVGSSSNYAKGLDTEVFTFNALRKSYDSATIDYELEHVTPYIYRHSEQFRIHAFQSETDYSHYRLTLDTIEDWQLISTIYDELYTGGIFPWKDVLSLLEKRPELAEINADVRQKQLGE